MSCINWVVQYQQRLHLGVWISSSHEQTQTNIHKGDLILPVIMILGERLRFSNVFKSLTWKRSIQVLHLTKHTFMLKILHFHTGFHADIIRMHAEC